MPSRRPRKWPSRIKDMTRTLDLLLPYGAPQPQQAGGVDESLNGFDADEDMRVDYMKNEMLQKAQQKAAQRGVQPV
jgi:hypothetical protein